MARTGLISRRAAASVVVFLLLFAAAAYLRFYRLSEQGILSVDEGRYVLDTVAARAELDAYLGILHGKWAELHGGPDFSLAEYLVRTNVELQAHRPGFPKPAFAWASALIMKATGDVISACSCVEAICGVTMIVVLFGLVWRLSTLRAAFIASALLAFSVFHIYFSRNAYPQCCAGALFMLALWCHNQWYRTLRPRGPEETLRPRATPLLFPCGLLLGLAFSCNYQIAGAFPAIVLVHVAASAHAHNAKAAFHAIIYGAVAIVCGFVTVIVFTEAWSYPLIVLFRGQGLAYPHGTFFELLAPRLVGQSSMPWNPMGWCLFPYFLSVTDGPYYVAAIALPVLSAALHVLYRIMRSPRTDARLLLHPAVVYTAIPLIGIGAVFSLKTMQGARMFVTALPFLFAAAGIAVDYALRNTVRWPRIMLVPAAACMLVTLFFYFPGRLHEAISIRSAYPDALEFARTQEPPAVCAAWSAVLEAYGVANGLDTRSVYSYARTGEPPAPIYVSDWQELYNRRAPSEPLGLKPGATPVHVFAHDFGKVFLRIEAFPCDGSTRDNIQWIQSLDLEENRKLLVYDSGDIAAVPVRTIASP